jgi:hypothetical protein
MSIIIEHLLQIFGVFIILIMIDYKRRKTILEPFTKDWFFIMFFLIIAVLLIRLKL